MTLLWAIAGFFGFTTVLFAWLCARAPYGEEIPGVGFRLTPEPQDLDEHTRLDGDCPWPLATQTRRDTAARGNGSVSAGGVHRRFPRSVVSEGKQ